jgi:hypothetical protein
MAISTAASGTQSCTLDTVHTLTTQTTAGVYVCQWNLTNLAKGDIIRVFVETKVLTGDTAEIVFEGVYANDLLSDTIVMSPAIVSMFSLVMKVEQTDGTGRSVPWACLLVAT